MSSKNMIWFVFAIAFDLLIFFSIQHPVKSAIELSGEDSQGTTFPLTSIAEAESNLPQSNHEVYQERVQNWRENQRNQHQKHQDIRRQQQEQFQRHNEFRRQQQEQILSPREVIRHPREKKKS